MTRTEQATDILVGLIRHLDGPAYAPQDIEWATSLPAGRTLIEWLASQVPNPPEHDSGLEQWRYHASLESIALHDEEIHEMENTEKLDRRDSEDDTLALRSPPGFIGVQTLRSHADRMESEAELLESETGILRHRLKNAKVASKRLNETIRTLRSEVREADDEIRRQEERLGELSLQTDTSVSMSVRAAVKVLEQDPDAIHAVSSRLASASALRSRLASASALRSEIVAVASQRLAIVDQLKTSLPSPAEITQEAERMKRQFTELRQGSTGRHRMPGVLTRSYCTDLDKLSGQLEAAHDEDSGRRLLEQMVTLSSGCDDSGHAWEDTGGHEPDVEGELSRAWHLDQLSVLAAHEGILDETIEALQQDLMPALGGLHDSLARRSEHELETEALVSALVEELEEMGDDIAAVRDYSDGTSGEGAEEVLEGEMVETLKQLQGLRRPDGGPLVLLDHTDLTRELHAVSERLQAAESAELEWTMSLMQQLSALSNSHSSLISTIYANSPVVTSPPFSLAPEGQDAEKDARQKVEELNEAMLKLEKEARLSDGDERKLNAYVEKWARG